LEDLYFPDRAQVRKQKEEEDREERQQEAIARIEDRMRAVREKYPHLFPTISTLPSSL
jgi:hypothetical protein